MWVLHFCSPPEAGACVRAALLCGKLRDRVSFHGHQIPVMNQDHATDAESAITSDRISNDESKQVVS